MKKNQLCVRLYGESVGVLEQTPTGKMLFSYNSSATMPISIGMPIREEAYGEVQCEAFFGGLLPESDNAKREIGKRYGVSYNNSFALLRAIGYDCAGAISCHRMDEHTVPQRLFPLTGKIVTENELYKHIKALPKKPLFMDFEGLRLSLAGAYDKAAVCIIDNEIAIPQHGCPTTHILKPGSQEYEGMVHNEYFCLKLAGRMGLPVPNLKIRQIKDICFLLIERYDRHVQNKQVERIHQEDFCQVLGIVSSKKYQSEGGPAFKACFELLKNTTQPAIDRNLFASIVVFNYLICNTDAHGKNFSLLHRTKSNLRLAPFYDILCTQVYPKVISKMAMKIGGQYESNHVFSRHWKRLCEDIHYSYPAMLRLVKTQADVIVKAAMEEREQLIAINQYHPIIDQIINAIKIRSEQTLLFS